MKKVPVRKLVFGILGVVLGLIIGFMAPPAELTVESMHYLGLLVWFICWMIGGVMPDFMTGITFLVLAVLLKLCDFTTAFSPFAGTTTWLLVGAFGVGAMLNKTGVLRRIAYVIMQLFPGTYTGQMLALYAAGIIVSPMMPSITAKAALMSPLSIPAAEAFGFEKNSKGATGLFMASYWSSGILGNFFFTGCVYVGTMMAYLDEQTIAMLNFWSWLKYFWPYLLVFAVGGFFILRILFQPKEYQPLPAGFVKEKLKELGPMSRDEKLSLIILVIMVAGWLTADLTGISVTIWSVIGLILMSGFGIFKPADFGARIPWTIITLIASISTLATLMGTYGIPDWLTAVLAPDNRHRRRRVRAALGRGLDVHLRRAHLRALCRPGQRPRHEHSRRGLHRLHGRAVLALRRLQRHAHGRPRLRQRACGVQQDPEADLRIQRSRDRRGAHQSAHLEADRTLLSGRTRAIKIKKGDRTMHYNTELNNHGYPPSAPTAWTTSPRSASSTT